MKTFQQAFNGRPPTDEEVATVKHVTDIALAWRRGELPITQVRTLCTERDRFTAIRFQEPHTKEHTALLAMLDALIRDWDARAWERRERSSER